jgi:hypothetical protein
VPSRFRPRTPLYPVADNAFKRAGSGTQRPPNRNGIRPLKLECTRHRASLEVGLAFADFAAGDSPGRPCTAPDISDEAAK